MMGHVLSYIGLIALLLAGSAGWGAAANWMFRLMGWREADEVLTPALRLLVGMAMFLAVGGILVASDAAYFGILIAWHVVGTIILCAELRQWAQRRGTLSAGEWLTIGALTVAGALVLLASLAVLVMPDIATSDDDPAYIYLAERLLKTGGLVDPFNLRRVTEYGGSTLYQSIFLRVCGNSSFRGFEWSMCLIVVLVVAIGTTRRRWVVLGVLLLGAALLVGHGLGSLGPLDNLGPTFSATAFSLGCYQLLGRLHVSGSPDDASQYIAIGLFLAALLALRFYFVLPVALATIAIVGVFRGLSCVRGLLIVAATTAIATSGWAIALLRSSGTVQFPLFAGNYDTLGLGGSTPTLGRSTLIGRFGQVFTMDGVGLVAVLAIVVGLICLALRYGDGRRMAVLVTAGTGCFVELALLTYALRNSYISGIVRFAAPSTLACGLLTLDTLWPLRLPGRGAVPAPPKRGATSSGPRSFKPRFVSGGSVTRPLVVGVVALGLLATAAATFGPSPVALFRATKTDVRLGTRVAGGSVGFSDRYHIYRPEYARVNRLVPTGAKVLAAVQRPALLDFGKYSFSTLDGAGSVSPPPHLPFFRGPLAIERYLRQLGYRYILAESPSDPGLYNVNMFYALFVRSNTYFKFSASRLLHRLGGHDQISGSDRACRREVRRLTRSY